MRGVSPAQVIEKLLKERESQRECSLCKRHITEGYFCCDAHAVQWANEQMVVLEKLKVKGVRHRRIQ